MDILDIFWTFYLNHLSPLWGYFWWFQGHLNTFQKMGDLKKSKLMKE